MPHSPYWAHLTSRDFAALDRAGLIAVLPVGAIEQHGPHLPMSTDTATIDAMVAATAARLPADLPVLFMPATPYGKSNEHSRYPGTLTLSAQTLISIWMELGACVARAGIKKLVLFNSHGGQMSVMDIVARDLREQHGLMVVAANWFTLGLPAGLFSEREQRHGIHGGDLETSVMQALVPQYVKRDQARDFASLTETLARDNRYLGLTASGKLGWQTHDLNPEGAAGEAHLATPEKGRIVIDFVAERFIELLREVQRFDLAHLAHEPAWR
jgi:creatinine amidohydrolase